MFITLVVLNLILIAVVVFLLIKLNKPRESGPMSELEGIDLIEFQQNLKSLIDELSVIANTRIIAMEEVKKSVEQTMKAATERINEMKYLMERNQLRRQAEYKEAIHDTPSEIPAAEKSDSLEGDNTQDVKDTPAVSRLVVNGLEDNAEAPVMDKDFKAAGRDKYQHINTLLNNGLSVDEIAKVTGLTRGEIQLIRNIKR